MPIKESRISTARRNPFPAGDMEMATLESKIVQEDRNVVEDDKGPGPYLSGEAWREKQRWLRYCKDDAAGGTDKARSAGGVVW